jgi:hypothetical protein
MYKKIIPISLIILICFVSTGLSQETRKKTHIQEQFKETLQVRQQIREIEMKAIENDEELKNILKELKILNLKMKERLNSILANDTEYQELKKKTENIKKDWKRTPR